MYFLNKKNKAGLSILLVIFLLVNLFGIFSLTSKNSAQAALPPLTSLFESLDKIANSAEAAKAASNAGKNALGAPVAVVADTPSTIVSILEQVETGMTAAAMSALMNGMSYFTRKLAYDAAKYVSYGGKGKGALIYQNSPGDYFKNVALDSVAEGIESFGQPFGLNLCQTPNLQAQLYIQIGLRNMYDNEYGVNGANSGGPTPKCNWQNLSDSWSAEAFERKYGPGGRGLIARTFHDSIRVKDTDFGIAMGAMAQLDRLKAKEEKSAEVSRLEGGGIKAVTDLISDKIKTPGQTVAKEMELFSATHNSKMTSEQIAGVYGAGMLQILPQAASVFLNTLATSLLDRLMSGDLLSGSSSGDASTEAVTDFYSQVVLNKEKAEKAFSFLFTDFPNQQLNNYPLLTEFAACEESGAGLSLNNCVMDTGLQRALEVGRTEDNPLTIKEAMDQDMLHAKWSFISPKREIDNQDVVRCYQNGYCYYNIQKLRKARILPLGFEIAALRADPDNLENWTLENVVNGFEDCNYEKDSSGNEIVVPSSAKPFCHLVNPNWILKIPEIRCESLVVGPQLIDSGGDVRRTECVEYSTTIFTEEESQTDTNKIENYYSYCLQEKNIWKLGVETCDKQYNTCQTYVNNKGEVIPYLNRTLDYGRCNLESVGCQPYALEGDKEGWLTNLELDVDKKLSSWNQNIYFNNKIANFTCSEDADGCNLFYDVRDDGGQGNPVYLQKAPDYLGCYDKDIYDGEYDIDWPQTKVDLVSIKDRPEECADFSQVCISSEVGCQLYSSIADPTSPEIPGIIGDNLCQAECVGYDTYKQLATEFEPEEFPLYFTPGNDYSSQGANECNGVYAGCDQFTNIDEMSAGGEGLEYYIDLKYCEDPSGENEKAYYSWEGSELTGYVLKIHRMKPVDVDDVAYLDATAFASLRSDFPLGSPVYAGDSEVELEENYASCNEDIYNLHLNSPYNLGARGFDSGCRALYDREGSIYYRILSKTVIVSDDCHPLRKTKAYLAVDNNLDSADSCTRKGGLWNGNDGGSGECQRCSNGGFYDEGYQTCIYYSIPSESISCPAIANGCRKYVGNQGGNIEEVYFAGFEPTSDDDAALEIAQTGWTSTAKVRPESIYVGGYSLQASSDITYIFQPGEDIDSYAWYELSFWARGEAQNINEIYFKQAEFENSSFTYDINLQQNLPVSLGNEWQEYKFGPVQFTGTTSSEVGLKFIVDPRTSGKSYYLDNVRVTRLEDQYALIKDSWKTSEGYDISTSCDVSPYDGFPGLALGCQAYRDDRDRTAFAIGFDSLCRPEAVGCTALYDTYNTLDSEDVLVYNLWCVSDVVDYVGECKIEIEAEGEIGVEPEELGTCQIENGQTGCFVEEVMLPYGVEAKAIEDWVVDSTIIIPADTPVNSPIYLTDTENYICYDKDMGCTRVAAREYKEWSTSPIDTDFEFVETFVKNDPGNYSDTLCTSDQVSCGEFKSDNGPAYFKDPKLNGNGLCVYRPLVEDKNGNQYSGWYRDIDRNKDGKIDEMPEPCGPRHNYEYQLPSNGSVLYEGLVGVCPSSANNCRELIDKADTGGIDSAGRAYYIIYDQEVERRSRECESQVNLNDGCVLFDKTDEPNKIYNTALTYEANSQKKDYASGEVGRYLPVRPVSTGVLDANIILKVDRDRTCNEWLACQSYKSILQADGTRKKICYSYGSCLEMGPGGECALWESSASLGRELPFLDYENYISRGTSWYDEEYSGYSLYNKFSVGDLQQIDIDNKPYLVYVDKRFNCNTSEGAERCENTGSHAGDKLIEKGQCINGIGCVMPVGGDEIGFAVEELSDEIIKKELLTTSCKSYPEDNSPFSKALVLNPNVGHEVFENDLGVKRFALDYRKNEFDNVQVCQDGECSCGYSKVTYRNSVVDYWPYTYESIPAGICSGGGRYDNATDTTLPTDNVPCFDDRDCGDANDRGTCILKQTQSTYLGQEGFCLEYDKSRPLGKKAAPGGNVVEYPCLTWLPKEVKNKFDIYESSDSAGFNLAIDGEAGAGAYCVESSYNHYNFDEEMTGYMSYDPDNIDLNIFAFGTTKQDSAYNNESHKIEVFYNRCKDMVEARKQEMEDYVAKYDGKEIYWRDRMIPYKSIYTTVQDNNDEGNTYDVLVLGGQAYLDRNKAKSDWLELEDENGNKNIVFDESVISYKNNLYKHKRVDLSSSPANVARGPISAAFPAYSTNTFAVSPYEDDKTFSNTPENTYHFWHWAWNPRMNVPAPDFGEFKGVVDFTKYDVDYLFQNKPAYPNYQPNEPIFTGPADVCVAQGWKLSVEYRFDVVSSEANNYPGTKSQVPRTVNIASSTFEITYPDKTKVADLYNEIQNDKYFLPEGYQKAKRTELNDDLDNPVCADSDLLLQKDCGLVFCEPTMWGEENEEKISNSEGYDKAVCCDNEIWSLSRTMQRWAWEFIGKNSILLRTETGLVSDGYSFGCLQKDVGENIKWCNNEVPSNDQTSIKSIFSFAPHPTANRVSYGTIMHPPRVWPESNVVTDYSYFYKQQDIKQSLEDSYYDPPESDGRWNISTIAMSPGPWMSDVNNVANMVNRSKYEGVLNISDLDRVYFVPLAFPFGAEGRLPALLSKDMYIDFNKLRNGVKSDFLENISNASYSDSESKIFTRGRNKTIKNIVWSYHVDEVDLVDLSFNNYENGLFSTEDTAIVNALADERNKITDRYVMLFADSTEVLQKWFGVESIYNTDYVPTNGREESFHLNDPFATVCKHDTQEYSGLSGGEEDKGFNTNNWLAIGMDFNKDGEFLGYVSRFCFAHNNADAEDAGIMLATIATLNNQCVDFAQVYKDPGADFNMTTDKAWTNRVWEFAPKYNTDSKRHPSPFYKSFLEKDQPNKPFGAMILSDKGTISENFQDPKVLRHSSFLSYANFGIPYSCRTTWLSSISIDYGFTDYCGSLKNLLDNDSKRVFSDNFVDSLSERDKPEAQEAIFDVFKKVFINKTLKPDSTTGFPYKFAGEGEEENLLPNYGVGLLNDEDRSGDLGNGGNETFPPKIYSLNPDICVSAESDRCTAGEENNFTINMRNGTMNNYSLGFSTDGVPIPDEDGIDGGKLDGYPDPIVAYRTLPAILRFFVTVDDNHMPLKRVMINWDDGDDDLFIENGLFKNSKPYCASKDEFNYEEEELGRCRNTSMTCLDNADCTFMGVGNTICAKTGHYITQPEGYSTLGERRFGDAPRACTPSYKEYFKSLSCDLASANFDIESDSLPGIGLLTDEMKREIYKLNSDAEKVCVFKPKVQVLDNWGWCNSLDGEGVYNDELNEQQDRKNNYCDDYLLYDAYTEYKGNIIIVPGNE